MSQYRMKCTGGGKTEDDEGGYWEGFVLAMKGKHPMTSPSNGLLTYL
jgi:hypothetical protein